MLSVHHLVTGSEFHGSLLDLILREKEKRQPGKRTGV
jgi:hypothetical protein